MIFLFAWLAAPMELPGSRPELGDIDDDDDVRQTQMTPGVRGDEKLGLWRCQGFLRGLTPLTMEGTPVTWKGGRETDTAKRGLAMEWELSGAPVTAFRHRGDGDRIPPFRWQEGAPPLAGAASRNLTNLKLPPLTIPHPTSLSAANRRALHENYSDQPQGSRRSLRQGRRARAGCPNPSGSCP